MCVWRLRNAKEVAVLCEELSGVYDAKTLLEMYRQATAEPYSFMFIRLDAKTRETMFFLRFESRLVPEDVDIEETDVGGLANSIGSSESLRQTGSRSGAASSSSAKGAGKE
jgi:hypothetical protein